MNKIATLFAILALCIAPAFAAGPDLDTAVAEKSCGSGSMWIPDGANIVTTEKGSLSIEPPAGWVYVGFDRDGVARAVAGGDCSCDCTSSSGNCMPSIFKGDCSCTAKDGCTSCSLSTGGGGIAVAGPDFVTVGDFTEVENGGYIQFDGDIRLTEKTDLPMAFDAMFELPAVEKALDAFFDRLYPTGRAPEMVLVGDRFEAPAGYELATVEVFGRSAVVVVPQTRGRALEKAAIGGGGGGSCSCTSGSCSYDSAWTPKGTLHYCDGDCSGTCTLSMDRAADQLQIERTSH